MKKYNNRRTMNMGKGDFLVVHEGLQNCPDLINEVESAIEKLKAVLDGDAHLSDCGIFISGIGKNLEQTAKKCFDYHKKEQAMTLEQFNHANHI